MKRIYNNLGYILGDKIRMDKCTKYAPRTSCDRSKSVLVIVVSEKGSQNKLHRVNWLKKAVS